MSYRFALSTLLCVTLSSSSVFAPPAFARVPARLGVGLSLGATVQQATVAVLGLEGADEAKSRALTDALRKAFEDRGMAGGEPFTVAEVRLMMGCETESVACLAQAGQSMGVDKILYGSLEVEGDGHRLVLSVVDVAQASEEAQTSYPLATGDLEPGQIDDKAKKIVQGLFPAPAAAEEASAPPPPPVVTAPPSDARARDQTYVWGAYKPRPAWKWAGFGTGVALTALGLGTFIGTGVALQGPMRDELLETAEASLSDRDADGELNTANDIDPNDPAISDDLCAAARRQPEGQPGRVTNASVTRVCNRADTLEAVNIAGIGVAAAGVVTMVVFTTLLFVHRRGSEGKAAALRSRFRGGVAPRWDGAAAFGEFRF